MIPGALVRDYTYKMPDRSKRLGQRRAESRVSTWPGGLPIMAFQHAHPRFCRGRDVTHEPAAAAEPYPRGRFWDNLIPLRKGLSATQTAKWRPGPPVESDTTHHHAHFHFPVPPYFSRSSLHYGPETYVELQQVP
jgi:hypothetical protein